MKQNTKLFSQLKVGTWFGFPSKHYRKVVFIKTEEQKNGTDFNPFFMWNTVYLNGKHAGMFCHFPPKGKVVPLYRKDLRL